MEELTAVLPSNGEVRQEFSVVYHGRPIGGDPTLNDEATQVEWVPLAKLDELKMAAPIRERIAHYFEGSDQPFLG